jgi:hypothetical protein
MLSKRALTPSRPGSASRRKIVAPEPEPEIGLGWNPAKVTAFERAFWEFAGHVRINSKEKGGNYPIIKGLYVGQRRFISALFGGLAEDKHVIKCLKSRQLGMSTIAELFTCFWLGVHDGMLGGLVFDTGSHTAGARVRIKNLISNLPRSYKFPRIVADNRDGLTLENQSRLIFMSAGVRETSSSGTLGRSEGLNFLWASELCSWVNTEGITALKNSLTDNYPDRVYIWESTARGFNSWHDIWMEAKGNELEEVAYFAGWWSKDDQRILRGTPLWKVYGADPPSDAEQRRMRLVRDLYDFDIDLEQLAWYRRYIDPTRDRDDDEPEDGYQIQDQPWVEDDAFQQSGSPFFRADKLTVASQTSKTIKYRPYRFWPGDSIISCDIQPSKTWKEVELKVWEDPVAEGCYVVAGDPAYGRNEFNNNSCAQVLRCYADGLDQVAEYTSAIIEPHQFAWLLWTLVGWYGSAHQSQVMTTCELNGSGEEVLRQYNITRALLRDGYLRTAAREIGINNIFHNGRMYVYSRSDTISTGHNFWWKTSSQLKVQMMDGLRGYFHNDVITIRSYDALEEMKTIAREGDKIGAPSGKRDDRNSGLAFGVRAWEEHLRRNLARSNRTREADRIRRLGSPVDVMALFQKNLLEDMFKRKAAGRRAAALAGLQRPGFRMR